MLFKFIREVCNYCNGFNACHAEKTNTGSRLQHVIYDDWSVLLHIGEIPELINKLLCIGDNYIDYNITMWLFSLMLKDKWNNISRQFNNVFSILNLSKWIISS